MFSSRHLILSAFFGALVLLVTACGPTYPKCESDGNCEDKSEYCLNGTCAQCRDNSHCKKGEECVNGKCKPIPGYCDEETPCPEPQKCRDNRCGPQCLDDAECEKTEYCASGSCTDRPECGPNSLTPDCPEGKECVGGSCQIKIIECSSDPVYFSFNSARIKRGERDKLSSVAECLKGENTAPVTLEGHCDERGTEEYNMALGESRASAARKYMIRLGVSEDKLETMSYGKERPAVDGSNESAWSKNRRTEFIPRN